jgi:hypothetical protein
MAEARAELALDHGDTDEARRQLELLIGSGDKDAWRQFGRVLLGAVIRRRRPGCCRGAGDAAAIACRPIRRRGWR